MHRSSQANLNELMGHIGYEFDNDELLTRALTHRSKGSKNYERLEFLGDSILGFVVAQWLFDNYPDVEEGQLTRMRASIVRKEMLAKVAREMELGSFLLLGEGELKSGGFNRDSILSDVVESIIGAIFMDSGLEQARVFILKHFEQRLKSLKDKTSFKDPKSHLQEMMQKSNHPLPEYEIIETVGVQHDQTFTVRCVLRELNMQSKATAKSKRLAEQRAAANLVDQLNS